MAKHSPTINPELKHLFEFIQAGKLFALQQWIEDGKAVRTPETGGSVSALTTAVGTGFHSIIEELLRAGGWPPEHLAEALELARTRKRFDIADLLVAHGAQAKHLDFETCCEQLDLPAMERHLRAGVDPNADNVFARVLARIKARPLLGFYRQFRSEFPALDDQAALALSEAVQHNQARWTALLAWAGADPFRPVPPDLHSTFPPAKEDATTAAQQAVWRNNPEILKLLRLKPTPTQALDLLTAASYQSNSDLFRTLVAAIPRDQINNTPRGSCAPLERLVERSPDRWSNNPEQRNAEALKCIELLLDAGAKWNPPVDEINSHRRCVLKHDGRYLVQLVRLLLYTPGAATTENVLELCRSQTLQSKVAMADSHLAEELKEVQKKVKLLNGSDAAAKTDTPVAAVEHTPS